MLHDSFLPSHPRWSHRVFVSYRAEDTGKNFVDHLFRALSQAGICVFREADDLRKGENISTELMKAIDESMISIIVISKNYASSWWCLEEAVKIVECKEMGKQKVFPVFFNVPPSKVRHHRGKFGEALTGLEQQFGAERVTKWKVALTKVANFGGWDLQTDVHGYESELIDRVVEGVQKEVNLAYSDVAEHPVGIHARVAEILASLHSKANTGDAQMIVIHGEVGVGKKTLANAIFKQIYGTFDDVYIFDLRSECSNVEGNEALKCLHKRLTERGLGSKKLLIVVNGVDHERQLDEFVSENFFLAPGSTIIITTRNIRLLVGSGKNCERYEVKELNFKEALQLFSLHAFGKSKVPVEDFVEISNRIASFVGGRPKELIYLGSHFRGRSSVQEWKDDFDKIRKVPHDVSQWQTTLTSNKGCSIFRSEGLERDDQVIEVEHVETPRAQEVGSKMAAYEQAHPPLASPASIVASRTVESLASTDQLRFVPKALGKRSCAFPVRSPEQTTKKIMLDVGNGSMNSIISGGLDIHSSTALEGKSSDSLYAVCQSACAMMMAMFHELSKRHNVDAIPEQAKIDEVEKLKVELAEAHSEANVAKAEVKVARSSVEAADLKAWQQGSKEFQKAVEEYIQQHITVTELIDKCFQTKEGKARIIQEGKDAYYLGRRAMQQEIYDVLGRRAGFDINGWGLPKRLPDLLEKKNNENVE